MRSRRQFPGCSSRWSRKSPAAPGFGALVASLPLVSVLGMIWLWRDKPDVTLMADHALASPAHEGRVDYLRIVVRNLRQKLEADPARPSLIRNEPGVGYRLNAQP